MQILDMDSGEDITSLVPREHLRQLENVELTRMGIPNPDKLPEEQRNTLLHGVVVRIHRKSPKGIFS